MQQVDHAFGVVVQEAKVAGTPKPLGKHMLNDQPEEVGARNGTAL